jgi:hypothetical protein
MRKSGCHQHCESYIGWKKKHKAIKEQTRNELELKDYEIIRSKKIRKWKEEHY